MHYYFLIAGGKYKFQDDQESSLMNKHNQLVCVNLTHEF